MWSRLWAAEPVFVSLIGSGAVWAAAFYLLEVFGHPLTPAQQTALLGLLAAIGGAIGRSQVTSPATLAGQSVSNATRAKLPLLFLIASLGLGAMSLPACATNPQVDVSQLSAQGRRDFKAIEAVQIVDDVTTAVRAAVRAKVLPVDIGAQLLTVNKQILDVIQADPTGWPARVGVLIKNGRDALPPAWKARANTYLDQLAVILQGAVS